MARREDEGGGKLAFELLWPANANTFISVLSQMAVSGPAAEFRS
jgi:hypothetical protein